MTREAIKTQHAPQAVGPYSQGIRVHDPKDVVFTSGQLPATPDGTLVTDDIAKAARACLENVKAVLEAAGAGMPDITKVTIYLVDMADFGAVNAVYETFFEGPAPARSCVAVAALPKDARIEIEAIAVR